MEEKNDNIIYQRSINDPSTQTNINIISLDDKSNPNVGLKE